MHSSPHFLLSQTDTIRWRSRTWQRCRSARPSTAGAVGIWWRILRQQPESMLGFMVAMNRETQLQQHTTPPSRLLASTTNQYMDRCLARDMIQHPHLRLPRGRPHPLAASSVSLRCFRLPGFRDSGREDRHSGQALSNGQSRLFPAWNHVLVPAWNAIDAFTCHERISSSCPRYGASASGWARHARSRPGRLRIEGLPSASPRRYDARARVRRNRGMPGREPAPGAPHWRKRTRRRQSALA